MHDPSNTALSAPWESWELDATFFSALSRWTLEHPESSLDRVLDRLCQAIEHGQGLLEVIPDGPFPARGLVKALAHLLKLGKDVSTAQREVQTFAKEVIHWVNEIRASLESSGGHLPGQVMDAVWKDLAGIRDLIDEICKWATSRLLDQRWSLSAMKSKITVKGEIVDFKARLAEARAMFHELSIISHAQAMGRILKLIHRIFTRLRHLEEKQVSAQDQISAMLQKIQVTQTNHFNISNAEEAERRRAEERHQYVAQMLSMHAVSNASYVEQGKSPCDSDTRVNILKEIMSWIEDTNRSSPCFLWLTGDPGCGKSAITASIARECKDNGLLFAQFFINRNNVDTTNPNSYFPSIARQLAARSDQIEHQLHDRLKAKPSVMDQVSSDQARALFIDTLRLASQLNSGRPVLVVIDGLDETDRQHLKRTADIFSYLFNELLDYPNVKILISSRTEDEIRSPFARTMNSKCVKHLHLDTADESSINDVSVFLRRKIAYIVMDNDLDWRVWPGDERMDTLGTRASGLFIWAVTAAKFIQEQIDTWGTECLDDVLNRLNSDGMGEINALYGLILQFTYKQQTDAWAFETFRRLVGAIIVLREPLCLDDIGRFLNLRRSMAGLPVDIVKFVKRLRTVLVAGADAINGQTVPRLHKSFFEFITSNDRVESQFYIDLVASHRELALQSLHQLTLVRSATVTIQLPTLFQYAFKFWSQHLTLAFGTASGVVIEDSDLALGSFPGILRRSLNNEGTAVIPVAFSQDRSLIQAFLANQTRCWNASTGTLLPSSFRSRHNFVYSTFAFTQDGRNVIFSSGNACIRFYNYESKETYDQSLTPHTKGSGNSAILCPVLLPAHNLMASVTADGHLVLWNTQNGSLLKSIPTQHRDERQSTQMRATGLAFSPSGYWLAVGYSNGTVEFHGGIKYSKHFGSLLSGGQITSSVCSLKFSPSGAFLSSGYSDGRIALWHTNTISTVEICRIENAVFKGHISGVTAIAFLPNESIVITGSADHTIRFWTTQTGRQSGKAVKGHTGAVLSIGVSPDGKYLVSGSKDKTVRIWDVTTRQLIASPFEGHSRSVHTVSFSPSGSHIASACRHRFQIWEFLVDSQETSDYVLTAFSPNGQQMLAASRTGLIQAWTTEKPDGITFKGRMLLSPKTLHNIAFSPDGLRVAASSASNHTIYLWDTCTGDLLISSPFQPIGISSLHFTQDDTWTIIITFNDGTTWGLEERDGKFIENTLAERSFVQPPQFFDVIEEQNLDYHTLMTNFHDVQWFPSRNPGSGLWAYINNHIVRVQMDGSMKVVAAQNPKVVDYHQLDM